MPQSPLFRFLGALRESAAAGRDAAQASNAGICVVCAENPVEEGAAVCTRCGDDAAEAGAQTIEAAASGALRGLIRGALRGEFSKPKPRIKP